MNTSYVSGVTVANVNYAASALDDGPETEVGAADEDIPVTDTSTLSQSSTSHRYVVK